LTKLWSNQVFQKDKNSSFQTLTDSIGKKFTISVLTIATLASIYWFVVNPSMVLNVFTAVLIIACPCAIALAAPFTLGNMLRILGKRKFYIKDIQSLERLAKIDAVVFDKTGTLTSSQKQRVDYEGLELSATEKSLLKNTLRASNHPLSRSLYDILASNEILTLEEYQEHLGSGLEGVYKNNHIKVGSANFVGKNQNETLNKNVTAVHVSSNENYKGCFVFQNEYRNGITPMLNKLANKVNISLLSGDNNGEQEQLKTILPSSTPMYFNQKPVDKMNYIKKLQDSGQKVMMVGDGLNDAGALAQSNVGVAIAEDVNVFSPACDAILDADKLKELESYFKASQQSMKVIKWSFMLSLAYNLVGLGFAVTGNLAPVVAAILMPLSSISIVAFTTLATNLIGRKLT
jgi:Cu+-exporting ATPase